MSLNLPIKEIYLNEICGTIWGTGRHRAGVGECDLQSATHAAHAFMGEIKPSPTIVFNYCGTHEKLIADLHH